MSSLWSRLGGDNFFDTSRTLDDRIDKKLENLIKQRPELAEFYKDHPRGRAFFNEPSSSADFTLPRSRFASRFAADTPLSERLVSQKKFPSFSRDTAGFSHPSQHDGQSVIDSSTQTSDEAGSSSAQNKPQAQGIPQYNLRNTVDLGQKAAEAEKLDELKNKRSMSAPPDGRSVPSSQMGNSKNSNTPVTNNSKKQSEMASDAPRQPVERIIPILVEGRDEPLVNANMKETFTEPRHVRPDDDDERFHMNHESPFQSYFNDSYGSPRNHPGIFHSDFPGPGGKLHKHSRYEQPMNVQHETVPQQKNQKSQQEDNRQQQNYQPHSDDIPQPQKRQEEPPQQQHGTKAHKVQVEDQEQHEPDGHPQPEPPSNDPIKKIQLIQNDVLALMTQVENFSGKTKKDKEYIYLDEMLTRNLLKLDVIDTDGKENIRMARKEAIKCIQQCIAVLENKAEQASQAAEKGDKANEGQEPNATPMEQNEVKISTKAILVEDVKMDVDEQNSNKNELNKCDSKGADCGMEAEGSSSK